MSTIQYTIRSVNPIVDGVVRDLVRSSKKSMNEVLNDLLRQGASARLGQKTRPSFESFTGRMQDQTDFVASIKTHNIIPKKELAKYTK
jgi:hypothetical protein